MPDITYTTRLEIRVTVEQAALWRKAAFRSERSLAGWARNVLDVAAGSNGVLKGSGDGLVPLSERRSSRETPGPMPDPLSTLKEPVPVVDESAVGDNAAARLGRSGGPGSLSALKEPGLAEAGVAPRNQNAPGSLSAFKEDPVRDEFPLEEPPPKGCEDHRGDPEDWCEACLAIA